MEYELYLAHHGVKGMKWGVRKKRDGYTTARQAHKNAKVAGDQAAKDAINSMNASPKKHTLREYNNAAKKAKRQAQMDSFRDDKARNKQNRAETVDKVKKAASEKLEKAKKTIAEKSNGELAKRGKAAIDVLMNGDSDWMGRHNYSDNALTEVRNRGKAAVERLMYSEEQIFNKSFYGRYDF